MAAFEKLKLKSAIEVFYFETTSNDRKTHPMHLRSGQLKFFFAILKQHVYAGNWSAKNREGLICRIKKCVQEIGHKNV